MAFRSFLYLDSDTVTDYLSVIEGSIIQGPVDRTISSKQGKGFKADLKVLGGDFSSADTSELKESRVIPEAAMFQRLYELAADKILYLESLDETSWKTVERGNLLEIQANVHIPRFFKLTETAESVVPFVDVMKSIDSSLVTTESEAAINGFVGISKALSGKPIPLLFEPIGTSKYQFAADLNRSLLRCALTELEGEATILGKVLRRLEKGKSHDIFSVLPSVPNLNRTAKRRMASISKKANMVETVKGPGALIMPVAVYR